MARKIFNFSTLLFLQQSLQQEVILERNLKLRGKELIIENGSSFHEFERIIVT